MKIDKKAYGFNRAGKQRLIIHFMTPAEFGFDKEKQILDWRGD